QRDFVAQDPEVLDAIGWHASGRVGLMNLDKIDILADYMVPGGDFPGVDKIRASVEHLLDKPVLAGFDTTIVFLTEQGKTIYPTTVLARNDLVMLLNKEENEA